MLQDGDPARLALNTNIFTSSLPPTHKVLLCFTFTPRSPWDEALQSLGQREEPRPAPHPLAIPTLGLRCHLQHTPAKCGLMGQAWHGKVSGGVIRVRWQAASSVGAILHSLFSASLKGNPLFALSLYSQWEAAGAFLSLSRPLMNSWLEILI